MLTLERILFTLYCIAGPGVWLFAAYLMKVGRGKMMKLRHSTAVLPESPPLVSILVPAKDEADHIRTCVDRIFEQTYPALELITINDRSTDATGDNLNAAAAAADRPPHRPMRVVHIDTLPDGWLGKCHALDSGVKHAAGEWLFFVDSDVKLKPDCLEKMLALAIDRGYDAVSIMTAIETHRFVEKLMLPLLAATWATVFTADQTNEDSDPDKALANGQVFLIRKSAYEQVGGHAAVRDRIVEDVELMRLLKINGFRTRFFAGRHLASTRMHTHLGQMFHAWARIFAGTARGSVWPMIAAIAFLLLSVMSVIPAYGYSEWQAAKISRSVGGAGFAPFIDGMRVGSWDTGFWWLIAAYSHCLLMAILGGLIWTWSGNRWYFALLLPISATIEIAILLFSIRKSLSGVVHWRGVAIDLRRSSRSLPGGE